MRTVAILSAILAVAELSAAGASGSGAASGQQGRAFRVALPGGTFAAIDPALDSGFPILLRPACGSLVSYPDEKFPAGERTYGVNESRFFVKPTGFTRMFVLNTSRPLFRGNPKLRQAVNVAVDRLALTRELGPFVGSLTDQYLRYRNERIYPLGGPDLRRARALAKGNLRRGRAVLYTRSSTVDVAQAQFLRQNLQAIGLDVRIEQFPGQLIFDRLAMGEKDFDIGRVAWGNVNGPVEPSLLSIFDGRTIGRPGNQDWSYFNSPEFNRRLDHAAGLAGPERYSAYGDLDVWVSKNAAPAIPVAFLNSVTLVSARTGCVVLNPYLDLTAVCLK